jgi:hypothetical protein
MNRQEALAPLGKGEARFPVTSGAFVRSRVRRAATVAMVDFYEEKGLLSSAFIFRGPEAKVRALYNWLRENS